MSFGCFGFGSCLVLFQCEEFLRQVVNFEVLQIQDEVIIVLEPFYQLGTSAASINVSRAQTFD